MGTKVRKVLIPRISSRIYKTSYKLQIIINECLVNLGDFVRLHPTASRASGLVRKIELDYQNFRSLWSLRNLLVICSIQCNGYENSGHEEDVISLLIGQICIY